MKRKLFFLERFIYGDGDHPFNAVLTVKVKGNPSLASLHLALDKVQGRHPLLRSRIVKDIRGVPYFVTNDRPRPISVRIVPRLSDEDWLKESKQEWVIPFEMDKGPLLRIVWIKAPEVSELLMVFHHAICNGGSAACLLHEILTLWDQPQLDAGEQLSYVTKDKLFAGMKIDPSTRRKARIKSLLTTMMLASKSIFISKKDSYKLSREKDYALSWKLDKTVSSALFNYCKEKEVTVNTALCAAFLSAFQAIRGGASYDKITCPVDIRKYLPTLGKDDLFAFAMAIDLPMPENDTISIWEKAAHMQKDAAEKMNKLDAAQYLVPMEYSHSTLRPLLKILRNSKPGITLLLSNMGRLEIQKQYGELEIETVYSPTVIGPFGDPTGIVTTTFDGKMDFCFLSNDECLPYADAIAIKEKAMQSLISNIFV